MNYQKCVEQLLEETPTDYILETHQGSNFIEFVSSCGGDIVTYRIYENGVLVEK